MGAGTQPPEPSQPAPRCTLAGISEFGTEVGIEFTHSGCETQAF